MSWNIDIAKDELNKLNVADDFKDFLVEKAHEYFAWIEQNQRIGLATAPAEADVAADPEGDADTSGASPEGNEGASAAATDQAGDTGTTEQEGTVSGTDNA